MNRHPLTALSPERVRVAPSILAADFSRLGEEILAAEKAGGEVVHIDVMDGHFVPNLSMGPPVVKAIRPVTALPFDVHLMLTDPGLYVEPFVAAGADHITIHVEANGDLPGIFDAIHAAGCSAGISLRPGTPAESLLPYLGLVDLILVMTVEPGFGGQAFREDQVPKIRQIRRFIDDASRPIHLEVDGGIAGDTAEKVVQAGGRLLVAGSSVFRHPAGIGPAVAALLRDDQV